MNRRSSDDEMISLIASGSVEKGFRLLVEKYQEKIYWNVRRMVKSHDDADDVVQNVFIKVYKNIGGFKKESGLSTWIYRISVNETLDYLRKKQRMQVVSMEDMSNLEEFVSMDTTGADDIQRLLKEAIDSLPDRQKMVFNLRYFEEMKYSEMSEILNLSVGSLKASYHHAARKIEEFVKKSTRK